MGSEASIEIKIDIVDVAPEGEETLFEFGVVILVEVAEKLTDHLSLLFREVRVVIELMDIT